MKEWLYRGGHPNRLAKVLNKGWAMVHSLGIAPDYLVTLEVVGRHSGKLISFPLVMLVRDGERYLVSMLGNEANWVRNIQAARGNANLRHGICEKVHLEEVEVQKRAAIIKSYLKIAPGARGHISVDMDAPITEFEEIAPKVPVFRVNQ